MQQRHEIDFEKKPLVKFIKQQFIDNQSMDMLYIIPLTTILTWIQVQKNLKFSVAHTHIRELVFSPSNNWNSLNSFVQNCNSSNFSYLRGKMATLLISLNHYRTLVSLLSTFNPFYVLSQSSPRTSDNGAFWAMLIIQHASRPPRMLARTTMRDLWHENCAKWII